MNRTTPLKRSTPLKASAFKRAERKESDAVAKLRKCAVKSCRKQFAPAKPFETWCSPECGAAVGLAKLEKQKEAEARKDRRETKRKLEGMKPPKWWKSKAKTAFHEYVRAIAEGHSCISCDTILLKLGRPGGDYDAGHFRSVGSAKHLEFDERNVWGQCKHCNDYLKGNQLEYERRLRMLKGDAFVDELLADQAPRHYKIADYQRIEATYKAKLRELKASHP